MLLNVADENVNGVDALSLTRGEISAREQAWSYVEALRRFLPGCEKCYIIQTGPKIGIRETRHIICEYKLTALDLKKGRHYKDSIARGAWMGEAIISQVCQMIYIQCITIHITIFPLAA